MSTLKRHGYYCRTRKAAVPATRSRSCVSCVRGKARCDNKRPECSRCIAKAFQCQYPAATPRHTGSKTQHRSNGPIGQRAMAPSLIDSLSSTENSQEGSNNGDVILDDAPVILDPLFIDIRGNCLDWNDSQDDFSDFVNLQSNIGTSQYPTEIQSSPAQHWIRSTNQANRIQQDFFPPYMSVPKQPTTTFRSLIRRPKLSTGAQRTANLILHTLKSYPLMMLDNGSLPPFIHPHLMSSEAENNNTELLINCICLVRMISNGIQKSRKLFWKNVRMECEQMCEEVC